MTETRAIPANLRGKETAIPAGYLFENKKTAGIAGIRPNPYAPGEIHFAWYVHAARITRTPGIVRAGSYPRFPRRMRVFMELDCGDRTRQRRHLSWGPPASGPLRRARPRVKRWHAGCSRSAEKQVDGLIGLPVERFQSRYVGKVRVPGCQREIMLPGHCRDPQIVVWNRFAELSEFAFDLAVGRCGVVVGKQNHAVGQQVADGGELFLPPLCSLGAAVQFTEHHPWQLQRSRSGEMGMQCLVTAKVRHDDVGVQQDTTRRAH